MTIKDQITQIIESPEFHLERQTESGSYRLSPSEVKVLALLCQAYSMDKSKVLRRLLFVAAWDYAREGGSTALGN